ncbi:MAG: hypothetical protein ABR886_11545 [Dehalococcoidales bacterium]
MAQYYGFVNWVAHEIGTERTLGILTKMADFGGTIAGKSMKQQAPDKKFELKTALQWAENTLKENLIPYQITEETPQKVTIKVTKCSNYDAAHMAMMDDKTIEAVCRTCNIRFQDVLFKQLNPGLSARIKKFRSTPDDFCEEEILLE